MFLISRPRVPTLGIPTPRTYPPVAFPYPSGSGVTVALGGRMVDHPMIEAVVGVVGATYFFWSFDFG